MLALPAFYLKALKFNFFNLSIGGLLGHVCFENYDFSHKMGKKLLVGLNKCNADDVRPYLDLIEPYLH